MEALLGSSGDVKSTISVIKTRSSIKPAREGLKAKAVYKPAVKVYDRLSCKSNRIKEKKKWLGLRKKCKRADRRLQFAFTYLIFANQIEKGKAANKWSRLNYRGKWTTL